jgi:hypothetical protein
MSQSNTAVYHFFGMREENLELLGDKWQTPIRGMTLEGLDAITTHPASKKSD